MQSQVRFNRVPEKVAEKVWEALVRSQVRFNRVPEKLPEKVWEALVQSQVRFNRVLEKVPEEVPEKVPKDVPEKVPGGFGAEPGQVQQGSGEGCGEGVGGFGAARSGSTGFRRRSGRLCKARSGSTGFPRTFRKVWEGLVQSQVGFNRVPEKVSEKVPGGFGAEPGQVQQDLCPFNSRKHSGGVASAWLGSTLPKIFVKIKR